MFKSRRNKIAGIVFVAILTYWQVFLQFFQQDEWHHFGAEIVWHTTPFADFFRNEIFTFSGIHFAPLTNLINYLQFSLFGLNTIGYSLVAILFHLLNSVLLFVVLEKLTKEKRIAFITSLLFVASIIPRQAVTWLVQHITTLPAFTFSFLSILSAQNYFSTSKKKWFLFSVAAMIFALGFKETAIFLGAFLPAYWLIHQFPKKHKVIFPIAILLISLFYSIFRVANLPKESAGVPLSPSENFPKKVLATMASGMTQAFVPEQLIIEAAKKTSAVAEETPDYAKFINFTVAPKLVYVLAGGIFLGILWFIFSVSTYRREMLIGLAFITGGSLPFILLTDAYETGLLASRYLYIPVVGASIILATGLIALAKRYKKASDRLTLSILVLSILGGWYFSWQETKVGSLRRGILTTITKSYPNLPDDVLIYTESDTSFYGLAPGERILPFQSGFGQTLLVWYNDREKFPVEFFKDDYLWEIRDEGYKRAGNRGFGYFRDFDLLTQTIERFSLPLDSVISFRYDSESGQVYDNTQEVRGRIEGYLSGMLPVSGFKVLPSLNPLGASLATDGSRETFWDSKLPYSRPQFVEIELVSPREVAHIRIDSYNNLDQNAVGYRVEISEDKIDWKTVFFAERYLPNREGYVDLYFEPKSAGFIRLSQVGKHDYASWVIHELSIYAKTN